MLKMNVNEKLFPTILLGLIVFMSICSTLSKANIESWQDDYPSYCHDPNDDPGFARSYTFVYSIQTQFYSRSSGDTKIKIITKYGLQWHESPELSLGEWTSTYYPPDHSCDILTTHCEGGGGSAGYLHVHFYES